MEARERYHHGALRQALLAEAFKVLEKEGLGGLSLRGIAEATGVSKTAPYRHFADKQALLSTLASEGFRLLADALEGAKTGLPGPTPQKTVLALCSAYVEFGRARPELYRLMFSSFGYALHSESCARNSARAMACLVGTVQEAQAGGWRTESEPRALVLSLWAEVHGWTGLLIDGLIPPELAPVDGAWLGLAETFLR